MADRIKDMAASVRARLLDISRRQNQPFDLVLARYANERLLYRLSISPHADRFILKGATLLMTWLPEPHRGTRDLDLLGLGDPDPARMLDVFRQVLAIDVDDGIAFDVDRLAVAEIRQAQRYGGLRLTSEARLSGARFKVTIDVGFGDSLDPGVEEIDYPVLLDMPAPKLRAYARETLIAEKFEAMVSLGRANSRMKDFYDIWVLSRRFAFEEARLSRAIAATFARRGIGLPDETPDALTEAFAADPAKQAQWRALVAGVAIDPGPLTSVVAELASFLLPFVEAARSAPTPKRDRDP